MIVGCYSIHLYCDDKSACAPVYLKMPHEFAGRDERECLKQARAMGWTHRKGHHVCPACNKAKRATRDAA